jgi:hypothetical protein
MTTIAEKFLASKGAPIEVAGRTVVNMYRHQVCAGQNVTVRIQQAAEKPAQGLRMKLVGGSIEINGQLLS